ncbi:MAG TPA: hypothetical protein VHK90_13740, partial [Thermoanaerobaculia bacterium]|nr:hypothetical protein [Thermoanaerobaculia bacterium]
ALAWNDHGRLHTAWLAQLGAPLVGERVVERVELDWSIAPVRPGLLATGYARIVDEPQAAGVHRAFVSLQQAPAPKRRAVR